MNFIAPVDRKFLPNQVGERANVEFFTYCSAGTSLRAERYSPHNSAPLRGSVVIVHGADGLTDHLNGPWATHMRTLAHSLAERGFLALIPHYLEKTGTSPGPPVLQSMFGHRAAWQQAVADLLPAAPGPVALAGFSLGGHLALRLRADVPVLVEFFAPLLDGIGPPPPGPPRHIQIHHGAADRLVDLTNAHTIARLLSGEGALVDLHAYQGASHGFNSGIPPDADALAHSLSRTVDFLSTHLEKRS